MEGDEKRKQKLKAIKLYLTESEEIVFRKNAMARYGYSRGALSLAAQEAVSHWNQHFFTPTMTLEELGGDPVKAIEGLLVGKTNKTSVELQHEVGKILAEKYEKKRKKWSK